MEFLLLQQLKSTDPWFDFVLPGVLIFVSLGTIATAVIAAFRTKVH